MFTFVESSIFSKELANYLDDNEYGDLQQYLINDPEAGYIILVHPVKAYLVV